MVATVLPADFSLRYLQTEKADVGFVVIPMNFEPDKKDNRTCQYWMVALPFVLALVTCFVENKTALNQQQ